MNETYDVSAFRAVFERSFTWISGFLRNVRRFGEKTAVIDPASGRTWTYAALNRDANRLANALLAAGRRPGRRGALPALQLDAVWSCPTSRRRSSARSTNRPISTSPPEKPPVCWTVTSQKSTSTTATSQRWPQRPSPSPPHQPALVLAVDARSERPALPEGHRFFDDVLAAFPDTEPITNPHSQPLRRGHAPRHLRHDRHAQGRPAEQCERGALRARRDHALPADAERRHDEHDAVVPPRRAALLWADRDTLRRGLRLWSCGCSARRRASMPWDDTASRF